MLVFKLRANLLILPSIIYTYYLRNCILLPVSLRQQLLVKVLFRRETYV